MGRRACRTPQRHVALTALSGDVRSGFERCGGHVRRSHNVSGEEAEVEDAGDTEGEGYARWLRDRDGRPINWFTAPIHRPHHAEVVVEGDHHAGEGDADQPIV